MNNTVTSEPEESILLPFEIDPRIIGTTDGPAMVVRETVPSLNRRAIREHLKTIGVRQFEAATLDELRRLCQDAKTPEDVLLELCDRGICMDELGHRSGPRRLLEKLANEHQYGEAILTIAKQLYSRSTSGAGEFDNFLQQHASNAWMLESLSREAPTDDRKKTLLLDAIAKHKDAARLHHAFEVSEWETMAKQAVEQSEIARLYATKEPRVLRALAANMNTPAPILRELSELKSVKLAHDIRSLAREALRRQYDR